MTGCCELESYSNNTKNMDSAGKNESCILTIIVDSSCSMQMSYIVEQLAIFVRTQIAVIQLLSIACQNNTVKCFDCFKKFWCHFTFPPHQEEQPVEYCCTVQARARYGAGQHRLAVLPGEIVRKVEDKISEWKSKMTPNFLKQSKHFTVDQEPGGNLAQ